ncbi:hypothetical protein [Marinifilum sp. D714]|uniref:hypothetical protein n=1 Tax=Marinifilum sp. D714 TaxID=2937523 RepID=UPI0027CBD521|nr:hypothetical protein [Marinifilum sp. D714]MDQ2178454.1 hypothetical protein [Marinifilum sp. D714]
MKRIYLYITLILALFACEKEPYDRFENEHNEVVKLELSASSTHLFANGVAEVEFVLSAYYGIDITEKFYGDGMIKDTSYRDTVKYRMRNLPEGLDIYTESGDKLENFKYSTESSDSELIFYAKAGDVESERVSVILEAEPIEELKEYVIPVVFHMVETDSHEKAISSFKEEKINAVIESLNKAFANTAKANAPHSIDQKVRFELVTVDPDGNKLGETGINRVHLGDVDEAEALSYLKDNLMWDHNLYLNIWVCKTSPWAQYYDPDISAPAHITTDPSILPGLDLTQVEEGDAIEITDPKDIGLIFAPSHFQDNSTIVASIGKYFGLLPTVFYTGWGAPTVVDGDVDYCADTYTWNRGASGIWKTTKDDNKVMKSVNIMDDYSIGSVVSYHQGQRVRNVLKYCPLRQYDN